MDSAFVSCDWLKAHLDDPLLRIIDLRGRVLPAAAPPPHYFTERGAYDAAHIPNAVFVDWQVDIVEPGSPSNDLASAARFAELMGRLGVDAETRVVIYDNAASMFAARLLWGLRYYGHERVAVLDGGWDKWLAEGGPTEARQPQVERRTFVPKVNRRLKADADEILAALDGGGVQLIDVRSPGEFAGDASRAKYGGHIPSAVNLPRKTMVAADMTVKGAADLREHFAGLGIRLDAPETVIYCNSGVSACFGLLALEVAGGANLRIYDGSWKEWGNDAGKPIAKAD